jgi:negative regulator of sigma E activity
MKHSKKENVSAMVDDALSSLEVRDTIECIKKDVELRATWHNYHFISSILQNSLESEWLAAEIKAPARDTQTEVIMEKHQSSLDDAQANSQRKV